MTGVTGGVEITTLADIPSAGSGLGSSSSVTVGLLQALFAYQGQQVSAEELADRACAIEIDRCRKPIGKQDQYAAAYGGICDIHFGPGRQSLRRRDQNASAVTQANAGRATGVLYGHHAQRQHHPRRTDRQYRRPADAAWTTPRSSRRGSKGPARGRHRRPRRRLEQELGGEGTLATGVSSAQIDDAVEAALLCRCRWGEGPQVPVAAGSSSSCARWKPSGPFASDWRACETSNQSLNRSARGWTSMSTETFGADHAQPSDYQSAGHVWSSGSCGSSLPSASRPS